MRRLKALSRYGLKSSLLFGGGQGFSERPFWDLPVFTAPVGEREEIEANFEAYVHKIYKENGIVFACILTRMWVFSEARFQYQRHLRGRPGDLFGNESLSLLENPWDNATTGELLAHMEQDASLAGNFFATWITAGDQMPGLDARPGPGARIRRLRPDWVTILTGSPTDDPFDIRARPVGYIYDPPRNSAGPTVLLPHQVVHYSPVPDPIAQWRGMSWITPVLEEIKADKAATRHKLKFLDSGSTSKYVVTYPNDLSKDQFDAYVDAFRSQHEGIEAAYRTIHLGGGADVNVVGADLKQLEFKATQGAGEPLALDTPIPTPTGWTTMGEIGVGDEVIGRDGLPARVTDTSPVHVGRYCYRVTFNDRTSIVADAGHLWAAKDRNTKNRAEATYTTAQLCDLITEWAASGNGGNRIGIPPAQAAKLPDSDLLIDPYVLGAWLGDGQTAGAAICGEAADLAFIADEIERRGYTITRWKTQTDKVPVIGIPGGLLSALDALDVLGDKRIPDDYLRASYEQRLDLLRGLMDTDGSVGHVGKETCEFSSKWEHLARQVGDLVRSLGYRATLSHKFDARSRTGGTWRLTFRSDPDAVPFLLPRKAARCVTPLHVRNRAIVSIEPVGSVPVRCIAVDSPDHLFCAGEGWVLTHNTRIAAAAGTHPVIVGLSEGMQGSSLNSGNFKAARRGFADKTMRPLWRIAAASLTKFADPPAGARLWYDDRDIPFLRDDQNEVAEIQAKQAGTIASLTREGYTSESVVAAVTAEDWSLLQHTGLFSVQLQPPMPEGPAPATDAGEMPPSNGNGASPAALNA